MRTRRLVKFVLIINILDKHQGKAGRPVVVGDGVDMLSIIRRFGLFPFSLQTERANFVVRVVKFEEIARLFVPFKHRFQRSFAQFVGYVFKSVFQQAEHREIV